MKPLKNKVIKCKCPCAEVDLSDVEFADHSKLVLCKECKCKIFHALCLEAIWNTEYQSFNNEFLMGRIDKLEEMIKKLGEKKNDE